MSIETTLASAAAVAAEQEWKRHRPGCAVCGIDRRRSKKVCSEGRMILQAAAELRAAYRESKRIDTEPGPLDVPLFGWDEICRCAGICTCTAAAI